MPQRFQRISRLQRTHASSFVDGKCAMSKNLGNCSQPARRFFRTSRHAGDFPRFFSKQSDDFIRFAVRHRTNDNSLYLTLHGNDSLVFVFSKAEIA